MSVQVTSQDFLAAVLQPAGAGAVPWLAIFDEPPERGQWGGRKYALDDVPVINGGNAYFSIAAFPPKATSRAIKQALGAAVVLLDDITTKGDAERVRKLLGEPSYKIQTSALSQQWGYLLKALAGDAQIKPIHDKLVAMKLCDKSGNNLVRYGRLPAGINNKAEYHAPFNVHCVEWHPERRFDIAWIAKRLEADFDPATDQKAGDEDLQQAFIRGADRYGAILTLSMRWANGGRREDYIEAELHRLLDLAPAGNPNTAKHHRAVAEFARTAVAKSREEDADEADFAGADPRIVEDLKALPENVLPLPNDYVPYPVAARIICSRLAPDHRLFVRGGRVVETTADGHLEIVTPADFRSRLEQSGHRIKTVVADGNQLVFRLKRCSRDIAEVLLASKAAKQFLPPIALMTHSPVLIEHEGQLRVLGPGYHAEAGGVMCFAKREPPQVPLREAVPALLDLVADFKFAAPGDRSRGVANFVGHGLRTGGWVNGHALVNAIEANKSQSGKSYLIACQRGTYDEPGDSDIAKTKGGVGSFDEALAEAIFSGATFISAENLRGRVASQYWEAILNMHGKVPARIPHKGTARIDISRVTFHLTSNGFEATVDFGNRSLITRLLHQPKGYRFKKYPEGYLLQHIKAQQPFYLGCVFAVIGHWHAQGKPRLDTDHSYVEWVGALDWIVQNVFELPPLLEDHEQAVERATSPELSWLRKVALAVAREKRLGDELAAMTIVEICATEIEIPGVRDADVDRRKAQQVGILMAKVFRDEPDDYVCALEAYSVRRIRRDEYVNGRPEPKKYYVFSGPGQDAQLEGM